MLTSVYDCFTGQKLTLSWTWKDEPIHPTTDLVDPVNGVWQKTLQEMKITISLIITIGVSLAASPGLLDAVAEATGAISFLFSNRVAYAAGDRNAPMKLQTIEATIYISLQVTIAYVFNFEVTPVDASATIYDASERRVRGRRDYAYLNADSERPKFLAAGMDIVDEMQPQQPVDVPNELADAQIRYATHTNPSRALAAEPLHHHDRRHRREEDGAWHFQASVNVVEDVPINACPNVAVTSSADMAISWSYVDGTKEAPFGHGVALSQLVDGRWSEQLGGIDTDNEHVTAGASIVAVPGTSNMLVAFMRIVAKRATLMEPKLGNAAFGEIYYSLLDATDPQGNTTEPRRLTQNSVIDADPQLHTDDSSTRATLTLTYLRQGSPNVDDPVKTVIMRRWDKAASTFGPEQIIAKGLLGGPVKFALSGSAEMAAFYKQDTATKKFFAVYSCRLSPQSAWTAPTRLDLNPAGPNQQSDIQLLGGRADGKILAAWLSTRVKNSTDPEWRLVSIPGHATGQTHRLKTPNATKHFYTHSLKSVRATKQKSSYLITIDTPFNVTATAFSGKPVYLTNEDMKLHAMLDSSQTFPKPLSIARETLEKNKNPVIYKAQQHNFAYDPKHERVVIAAVVEAHNRDKPGRVRRNLRVDTIDVRPDLAVDLLSVDVESMNVSVTVTNHGLQPTGTGTLAVYFGEIGGAKTKDLRNMVLKGLVSGESASFDFVLDQKELVDGNMARLWASAQLDSGTEAHMNNNLLDTYPGFKNSFGINTFEWEVLAPGHAGSNSFGPRQDAGGDGQNNATRNTSRTRRSDPKRTEPEITVNVVLDVDMLQRVNGDVAVVLCTLYETKDADGIVYDAQWQPIAHANAKTRAGIGVSMAELTGITAAELQEGRMLIVVLERHLPTPTKYIEVRKLVGNLPHQRVKEFVLPAAPDLNSNDKDVEAVIVDPTDPSVATITVDVANIGIRSMVGAVAEVWLPGTRLVAGSSPITETFGPVSGNASTPPSNASTPPSDNGNLPKETHVEWARRGVMLHSTTIDVPGRGKTRLSFQTDDLHVGHNEVVVLLNPDAAIDEPNYLNNVVTKAIHLDAPNNVEIDHSSIVYQPGTAASNQTEIHVTVKNGGLKTMRSGALFGFQQDSKDMYNYEYLMISEPVFVDIPASSSAVISMKVAKAENLLNCEFPHITFAFLQADGIAEASETVQTAISYQEGLPEASIYRTHVSDILRNGSVCAERAAENQLPVADGLQFSVFRDPWPQTGVPVLCGGFDPEGFAVVCTLETMDIRNGTLWHSGTRKQVRTEDLPVVLEDMSALFAPEPGAFWGDSVTRSTFTYTLTETASNQSGAVLKTSNIGTMAVTVIPYNQQELVFRATSADACKRICSASPKCLAVHHEPAAANNTAPGSTNKTTASAAVSDIECAVFTDSVTGLINGTTQLECYRKKSSGHGYELVGSGGCATISAAADSLSPGVLAAMIVVCLLSCLVAAVLIHRHSNAAANPSQADDTIEGDAEGMFDDDVESIRPEIAETVFAEKDTPPAPNPAWPRPILVVLAQFGQPAMEFDLKEGPNTIGRKFEDEENDEAEIQIERYTMCRLHATIDVAPGGTASVSDWESANKTYIGKRSGDTKLIPKVPTPLGLDSVVFFGDVKCIFKLGVVPDAVDELNRAADTPNKNWGIKDAEWMVRVFNAINDNDDDNSLDTAELRSALSNYEFIRLITEKRLNVHLTGDPDNDAKQLISRFDADGNGSISTLEFMTVLNQDSQSPGPGGSGHEHYSHVIELVEKEEAKRRDRPAAIVAHEEWFMELQQTGEQNESSDEELVEGFKENPNELWTDEDEDGESGFGFGFSNDAHLEEFNLDDLLGNRDMGFSARNFSDAEYLDIGTEAESRSAQNPEKVNARMKQRGSWKVFDGLLSDK